MFLFNMVLVVSLIISTVFGANLQDNPKARRAGAVGLFPFPRVGRSQPGKTWLISPQEYAELHHEMKRQGLIPFPRVGRAMVEQTNGKIANGDTNGGMWFGPRLGKIYKKSVDQQDPWSMIAFKVNPSADIVPRLSRESEDELEEDQMEQLEQQEQENFRQKRSYR